MYPSCGSHESQKPQGFRKTTLPTFLRTLSTTNSFLSHLYTNLSIANRNLGPTFHESCTIQLSESKAKNSIIRARNLDAHAFLLLFCHSKRFEAGSTLQYMPISLPIIELSVMCYPDCFPLLSPPHAIVILYLYYVLIPLQLLYSQF
jgi:hypothetical protein